MKHSALFSLAVALVLGAPALVSTVAAAQQTQPQPSATLVAQARPALRSGTFVAAEHPTSGSARIVTENGQRFLEFDAAFRTDQGPDLHVLLDTAERPPQRYQNQGSYVNLGRIRTVNGTQRYPIPAAINLASFKSVVIWCRMANATFGYATLGGASSASVQ